MKYTFQSSKYVLKNFFYILPFTIIPAFFFSLSTDEIALFEIMDKLFHGRVEAWCFTHLFRAISFLNFASFKSISFGVLGIVAMILCGALLMAFLEKHLRIGTRTYNGILSRLNDNFASTVMYLLVLIIIYELWSVATAGLLFFVSRITIPAVMYTLVTIVTLAMHAVLVWLIGFIYLWLPCMQITGFRAIEALVYVNRISSVQSKLKIFSSQMFVLLLAEFAISVCGYFLVDNFLLFTIVTTAAFAVMIMVYCVRMEIAYFHVDHLERADIKKYY